MTEAEIRARLRAWIGAAERRHLTKMLAQVQGATQGSVPQAGPAISGSDSFVYWTQKAMETAGRTSLSGYVAAITRIQESTDDNTFVGGWCDCASRVVTVCPRVWKASTKRYAVFLIHEGAHAKHGPDEATAVRIENQARRELGFWFMESEGSRHNALWQQELKRRG